MASLGRSQLKLSSVSLIVKIRLVILHDLSSFGAVQLEAKTVDDADDDYQFVVCTSYTLTASSSLGEKMNLRDSLSGIMATTKKGKKS